MVEDTTRKKAAESATKSAEHRTVFCIPSSEAPLAYRRKDSASIKNILIVSLSTFRTIKGHPRLTESRYTYNGMSGSYYYQLEPVPQVLMKILRDKGQRIDKILILTTKETQKPVDDLIREISQKDLAEKGNASDDSISEEFVTTADGSGVSPLDYFIYSVETCRKGALPPEYDVFSIETDTPEQIPGEQIISKIVSEIRKIHNPNIFVDTHGGFRTTQEILNNVLSLLQLEGIPVHPDHILTVEQIHGRRNEYVIRTAGSVLQVLQFVTGMNELINYARSESLESLMRLSSTDALEQKIISDTKNIAEAIQICNIGGFEAGLNILDEDIRQYDASPDPAASLLRLFIVVIKNTYEEILGPRRSVVREIRWCLKKGFYQQVLTLIESGIPAYLAEKGCFRLTGADLEKMKNDCRRNDGTLKYEINNFVFNRTTGFLLKNKDKDDLSVLYASTVNASSVRDNWEIRIYSHDFYGSKLTVEGKPAKKFLSLHWALKSVRNCANHVDEDQMSRITLDIIKNKVKQYVQIVDSMTSNPEANCITVNISYSGRNH